MESVFVLINMFAIPLMTAVLVIILWEIKKMQREFVPDRKSISEEKAEEPVDFTPAFSVIKREYALTDREIEILRELLDGNGNSDIAGKLFISENTVKTHIHNLLQKMGSASRIEAINKVQCTAAELMLHAAGK